jgi:uncharacterized protein YegL
MTSTIGLSILPEHESLAYDERQGAFVVVLHPPPAPQERPPLRLVMAIDASGSMHGEKMATALASAQAVVKALSSVDAFACVSFNGKARVVLPMTTMNASGKQLAAQTIRGIKAGGNTNLSDAILSSFELCQGKGRVLLLTDGCPTEGITIPDQLDQLTRGAARGATLSAFGFGRDVNPLLLSSLAETGRGNYTFIEAGEPPIEAIAAEVGGLLMTTAANLRLVVRPSAGVTIQQVLRTSDARIVDGLASLELPALVAEEEVALPLVLRWDEAALGGILATLTVQAYDIATGQPISAQASLTPRFASARGPLRPDAAREILLGRAAVVLHQASQALHRSERELAKELAASHEELSAYARAAGVDKDPQVVAALSMIKDAQQGLLAAGDAPRSARQDMVATSSALSKKRSTMMGGKGASQMMSQKAFTSSSQLVGIDLIKKMLDNDD